MDEPAPPELRRRNSIATTLVIPSKLSLPTIKPGQSARLPIGASVASSPALSLELISLKPSSPVAYTSLKDLLPSSVAISLPSSAASSASEISIRNRLVKQAAWAYVQASTLSASPVGPSGSQFLHRIWLYLSAGLRFVTRLFDWIIRSVQTHLMVR